MVPAGQAATALDRRGRCQFVVEAFIYYLFIAATPTTGNSYVDPEASEFRLSAADIFTSEKNLRQELADLTTEVLWLRETTDKPFWRPTEASSYLVPLQHEVARKRWEAARLRQEMFASQQGWRGKTSLHNAIGVPELAEHGPTLVMTMCAGSAHFDTYCGPFLASFERAYGAAAILHRVVVFVSSIEVAILEAARQRFRPWAVFEPIGHSGREGDSQENFNDTVMGNSNEYNCGYLADGRLKCDITPEGVYNRTEKVKNNNFWFTMHVADYLKDHHKGFCHAVVIDSDTLFVRPLGKYLPSCRGAEPSEELPYEWDVGVTVYTPDFVVPWAEDPASCGETKNGFARLNAGVVLLRLHDAERIGLFLRRWAEATMWLHSSGEDWQGEDWHSRSDAPWKQRWEEWNRDLLPEFRGPNQASLALIIASLHTPNLGHRLGYGERCGICREAVKVPLDMWTSSEAEQTNEFVRIRGLPAHELNHAESMPGGTFSDDLLVVHLKGFWWRTVLSQGELCFVDDFRRTVWNRDAVFLHSLCYETWQHDLPPEALPPPRPPSKVDICR